MSADAYRDLLTKSGLMKLRATALLAYGGVENRFEAAVLLHDVVRLEDTAFSLLSNPDPVSTLRHAIERWACLIDGLDPLHAGVAWERVELLSKDVGPATRKALRERTEPRWVAMHRAFDRALKAAPNSFPGGRPSIPVPHQDLGGQVRERGEMDPLLEEFPGVAHFWHRRAYLDNLLGDRSGAWDAVKHSVRLDPENTAYRVVFLWLAPQMLSPRELEVTVSPDEEAQAFSRLALILGSLEAAAKMSTNEERTRQLNHVERLLALPQPEGADELVRRMLRAAELLARDAKQGRPPSDAALQRTGFGNLVSLRRPNSNQSPMALLANAAVIPLAA